MHAREGCEWYHSAVVTACTQQLHGQVIYTRSLSNYRQDHAHARRTHLAVSIPAGRSNWNCARRSFAAANRLRESFGQWFPCLAYRSCRPAKHTHARTDALTHNQSQCGRRANACVCMCSLVCTLFPGRCKDVGRKGFNELKIH